VWVQCVLCVVCAVCAVCAVCCVCVVCVLYECECFHTLPRLRRSRGEYSKLTDIHMLAQGAEASLSFDGDFPYPTCQILAKGTKYAFVSTANF